MINEKSVAEIITQLQTELAELRQKVARLEGASVPVPSGPPAGRPTSRRRLLTGLGALALSAGIAGTLTAQPAQARLVAGSNPGAIVVRNGVNITGTLPLDPLNNNRPYNFGLVAASDNSLSLADLLAADTAITGLSSSEGGVGIFGNNNSGTGYGIFGNNDNNVGILGQSANGTGILALSDSGSGLQASSNSGTGLGGASNTGTGLDAFSITGKGAICRSISDYGCLVQSEFNAPLQIVANKLDKPVTADVGAIWVDEQGNMFIYTPSGWRQFQFVP